jgi:hypothetical protein
VRPAEDGAGGMEAEEGTHQAGGALAPIEQGVPVHGAAAAGGQAQQLLLLLGGTCKLLECNRSWENKSRRPGWGKSNVGL